MSQDPTEVPLQSLQSAEYGRIYFLKLQKSLREWSLSFIHLEDRAVLVLNMAFTYTQ